MANGRRGRSKRDLSREPGGFVAMPWRVMDSKAYQNLSHTARSLLLELACVFQPIVDAHFSRSWTAIQPSVDAVSEHRGRRFTVIVDDWGARK